MQNKPPSSLTLFVIVVVLGIVVTISTTNLVAQSLNPVLFEHFGIREGLSQNTVQTILEDHLGYLWFGTLDGLNRYDGYEFKVYNHSPWDSTSLGHNNVMRLAEDPVGALWMVTGNGVSRLAFADREAEKFTNFEIPGVTVLSVDQQNRVWLGGTGLQRLDPQENRFVSMDSIYPELRNVAMETILQKRDGTSWIGTIHNGLFAIRESNGEKPEVRNYRHNPAEPVSLSDNDVGTLYEDSRGNLWIGTKAGGLNRYIPESSSFGKPRNKVLHGTPSHHVGINAIQEDRNHHLWIGVEGEGLVWYNPVTDQVCIYEHDPANEFSLSHNSVISLWEDRSGILWIGTNGGGVNRLDPSQLRFRHYRNTPQKPGSLNHNSVWCFYEDRRRNFWVGTNKGLSRMAVDAGGATRFETASLPIDNSELPLIASRDNTPPPEKSSPSPPPSITVRAILEDRTGHFWIGSQNNGLFEYDPVGKRCIQYRSQQNDSNSIPSNSVYALLEDSKGELWIGGNGKGGLSQLIRNPDGTMDFQQYPAAAKNGGWVLCLHEDRQGSLWLGVWDHGLIKYERDTGRFIPLTVILEGGKRLGEYSVFSIAEDTSGTLWVGTYGVGLCRVSKMQQDTVYFKSYTEREGLPNNVIYGILPDELGNLWVSTNKGISHFNPRSEHFQNYTTADGLQDMEFNLGAAYRRRNGEMFFGGNNGFNAFYPTDLMNETPPQIVLTAVKKFGKKMLFKTPTSELRTINLSYKDDYLALEYVGLHYKHPAQNQYAYLLEGFDREWHYVGDKREAIYTNLPSGNYTFRVKAANSDGVWSEPGIGLQLVVHPPWWRTWWFYLLFTAIFGLSIMGVLQFRVRQAVAMEQARITERDRERDRIRRDLHVELGGKLSAVQHRLEKLIKKERMPASLPAGHIKKAMRLLQELENLFREYLWVLDREQMTLFDLVAQLKEYGDGLFEDTEIAFHIEGLTEISRDNILPLLWRQHLVRIFKEAINNVFRHARNCRNVTLQISMEEQWLEISLVDDGEGFDSDTISNGYGLQDMHDRAKKIGGELGIRSGTGKGSEVRFRGIYPDG